MRPLKKSSYFAKHRVGGSSFVLARWLIQNYDVPNTEPIGSLKRLRPPSTFLTVTWFLNHIRMSTLLIPTIYQPYIHIYIYDSNALHRLSKEASVNKKLFSRQLWKALSKLWLRFLTKTRRCSCLLLRIRHRRCNFCWKTNSVFHWMSCSMSDRPTCRRLVLCFLPCAFLRSRR